MWTQYRHTRAKSFSAHSIWKLTLKNLFFSIWILIFWTLNEPVWVSPSRQLLHSSTKAGDFSKFEVSKSMICDSRLSSVLHKCNVGTGNRQYIYIIYTKKTFQWRLHQVQLMVLNFCSFSLQRKRPNVEPVSMPTIYPGIKTETRVNIQVLISLSPKVNLLPWTIFSL